MSNSPALTFNHIRTTTQQINIPDNPIPQNLIPELQKVMKSMQADPNGAIEKLEKWTRENPKVGLLYNLLAASYAQVKREKEAEETIIRSYQNAPNYMFSKMSYARILMRDKKIAEIPKVFNHKLDLKELYPQRTVFHVSEAMNFYAVMGEYYANIKETQKAWACYDYVKSLDESDPAVQQLYRVVMVNSIPRWKAALIVVGLVLLVIAIIALISWGIYQLF
jgi:tetratricopeptide (TPR) repeat protein